MPDDVFDSVLSAAQEGANWAWESLVRAYERPLVGFFRARRAHDPENLAGEVWLEVARRINTFAGDQAGFRSWLFVIAYRRLVDEQRRRGRRPLVLRPGEALNATKRAPSAEDETLERLAREDLDELVASLTVPQRDVLVLRVLVGLTVAETAEVVGRSPGAVRVLQRRAVLALQKEISKKGVTK